MCHRILKVINVGVDGILLTPLIAVLLTSVVFIFGGKASEWQLIAGMAAGVGYCIAQWRSLRFKCLWSILFVIAFWVLLWLFAGCWVGQSLDETEYRFPAIRLMIMGWNPVFVRTPEAITNILGVPLEGCRTWHLLYMVRGVEQFCALFALWTKAPMGLSLGLPACLLLPVMRTLMRFPRWSKYQKGVCIGLLGVALGGWAEAVVDNVITLSAIGLIVTMVYCLSYRQVSRHSWLELYTFTFWMVVAKQSSLITCFVFWGFFSLAYIGICWKEKSTKIMQLSLFAGGVLISICFVNASPYLTSWKDYGHPLYPTYVKSSESSPIDLTGDFRIRNADALQMGHLGLLVNAYISETLSVAYYRWKLGVAKFSPSVQTWQQGNPDGMNALSPTGRLTRILLTVSTLLILWKGTLEEKWGVALIWGGLICFPTIYLGYMRYVPWWILLPIIGGVVSYRYIEAQLPFPWCRKSMTLIVVSMGIGCFIFRQIPAIDSAWELSPYLHEGRIIAFSAPKDSFILNTRLLERQYLAILKSPTLSQPNFIKRAFQLKQIEFVIHELETPRVARLAQVNCRSSRIDRFRGYFDVLVKTYCLSLPELLWKRLCYAHKVSSSQAR